jgi:hypothetical protein
MYIKYSSNYFKYSILVKIFENKEGYVRATLGSLRGWGGRGNLGFPTL